MKMLRKQATSDDGKLHSLKVILGTDLTTEGEGLYQGLAYRKDLLDDMGLEIPTTIDGWHDVLLKCKEMVWRRLLASENWF